MEHLGTRIAKVRLERELTQQALADRAGLQQSDISKLERGDSKSTVHIVKIAKALNCNPL